MQEITKNYTPLVSVIMPCYNDAERFLEEALESVLSQTYKRIEIIIVNDGSTDNSESVILNLIEKNKERGIIKYVKHDHNKGLGAARNSGIKCASGEIIAFLDIDDVWYSNKLEKQVEFMLTHSDIDMVFSNCDVISPIGKYRSINRTISTPITFEMLAQGNFIPMPTPIVKVEMFKKIGLFDEDKDLEGAADWDMWLRIAKEGKIAYIDEPLAIYRVRYDSLSRKKPKRQEEAAWKVFTKNILNDNSLSDNFKKHCLFNFYLGMGKIYYYTNYYSDAKDRFKKALRIKKFNQIALRYYIKSMLGFILGGKVINFLRYLKINFLMR